MQHWIGRVDPQGRRRSLSCAKNARSLLQPFMVRTRSPRSRRSHHFGADQIIDERVALGGDAFQQIAPPGLKMIDPPLHC